MTITYGSSGLASVPSEGGRALIVGVLRVARDASASQVKRQTTGIDEPGAFRPRELALPQSLTKASVSWSDARTAPCRPSRARARGQSRRPLPHQAGVP